jgi:hypothetical protein
MNNIVAIRVEQKLVFDPEFDRYNASEWTLVYMVEGETTWRNIPVLTKYRGGPHDGLSQLSDGVNVSTEKEK